MKNNDVALIRRVLAGDETAFAELVNKYQKPVHCTWRGEKSGISTSLRTSHKMPS